MKVYVTGFGVVSAIGTNAEENLQSLKSGRTGITRNQEHNLLLGSVPISNEEIIQHLNLPDADYSRTSLLSLLAAKEAWGENTHHPVVRTGFISATSVGGMDKNEKYYFEKKTNAAVYEKMILENGGTTEVVASLLGFSGFIDTISTACSSGLNSIIQGTRLMQSDKLDRVLVGGCDPLASFDILGFKSLNLFDDDLCKPFDRDRNGLNLGEGAAFILLENEESLVHSRNTPICCVAGWGNATDAYHQTASSPEGIGASLAMKQALNRANLKPNDIGYINAHGTGTPNNDASESAAIINVFETNVPPFSSTKGFTGHTLAAAGSIESVFCIMSLQHGILPQNIHFSNPMANTGLIPVETLTKTMNLNHVLTNSFGFGGNCSSLIMSKVL